MLNLAREQYTGCHCELRRVVIIEEEQRKCYGLPVIYGCEFADQIMLKNVSNPVRSLHLHIRPCRREYLSLGYKTSDWIVQASLGICLRNSLGYCFEFSSERNFAFVEWFQILSLAYSAVAACRVSSDLFIVSLFQRSPAFSIENIDHFLRERRWGWRDDPSGETVYAEHWKDH